MMEAPCPALYQPFTYPQQDQHKDRAEGATLFHLAVTKDQVLDPLISEGPDLYAQHEILTHPASC